GPHRVAVGEGPPRRVLAWAGPWPVVERWWEPAGGRRYARVQAVLDVEPGPRVDTGQQLAVLLACSGGRWWVEGLYE
ncbi:MAG: DNA polymerase Y family protein, partial [Actinomycetota bacterium]|nr:DNA polymerase Y family protein [Actinomycetota bacterium]